MTNRKVEDYERGLVIKEDDLNTCLQQQAELYYHVADECEALISSRDSVDYEIEKREAQLDGEIRRQAASKGEKITEKGVEMEIARHPDIIRLNEKLLSVKEELGRWLPLRGAYDKRSKMLELLCMREMRQLKDLSMERGTAFNRNQLVEAQSEHVIATRRRKLGGE